MSTADERGWSRSLLSSSFAPDVPRDALRLAIPPSSIDPKQEPSAGRFSYYDDNSVLDISVTVPSNGVLVCQTSEVGGF